MCNQLPLTKTGFTVPLDGRGSWEDGVDVATVSKSVSGQLGAVASSSPPLPGRAGCGLSDLTHPHKYLCGRH